MALAQQCRFACRMLLTQESFRLAVVILLILTLNRFLLVPEVVRQLRVSYDHSPLLGSLFFVGGAAEKTQTNGDWCFVALAVMFLLPLVRLHLFTIIISVLALGAKGVGSLFVKHSRPLLSKGDLRHLLWMNKTSWQRSLHRACYPIRARLALAADEYGGVARRRICMPGPLCLSTQHTVARSSSPEGSLRVILLTQLSCRTSI